MPIPNLASDMAAVLRHVGATVVYTAGGGPVTTYGFLRRRESMQFDNAGFSIDVWDTAVHIVRSSLPAALTVDDVLTIDGTDYVVRDIGRQRTDGLTPIALSKVF